MKYITQLKKTLLPLTLAAALFSPAWAQASSEADDLLLAAEEDSVTIVLNHDFIDDFETTLQLHGYDVDLDEHLSVLTWLGQSKALRCYSDDLESHLGDAAEMLFFALDDYAQSLGSPLVSGNDITGIVLAFLEDEHCF